MEGSGGAEIVDLLEPDGAMMAATHAQPAGNAGTALDAAEEGMAVAVAGSEATRAAAASGKKRRVYWGWATRCRRVKQAIKEEAAAAANSAVGTPSLSVPVEAVSDEEEAASAAAAA